MRRRVLLSCLLCTTTLLGAAESGAPAGAPTPAEPSSTPATEDPTAAIVATGEHTYRQRDVDALVQLAARYHRDHLAASDLEQLRAALPRLLVAREALVDALAALPAAVRAGHAGDVFLLELLAYRLPPGTPAERTAPPAPPAAAPVPVPTPGPATADAGTIVSLPPLLLTRTIQGERRQVLLGLALAYPDAATAKRFDEQAPIIRDAILGALDTLPNRAFVEPRQADLKQLLQAAIQSQLPSFPPHGLLIPSLDAGLASAAAAAAPATSAAPAAPAVPPAH